MRMLGAVVLLTLAACSHGASGGPPPVVPTGELLPRGTAKVSFGDKSVLVEVAATQPARERGLMDRSYLGRDAGMLFLFASPTTGGFYMKKTTIPLSVAYLKRSEAGHYLVLAIVDMRPLDEDPTHYDPKVAYDAALEVNQGWFARAGVRDGSRAVIEGNLPDPR